jgi:hypothetical protein
MENMKIKNWYLKAYPNDDMGQDLSPGVTFRDLFEALDNYQDVYVTLFGDDMGGDSLIRERIFNKLADIMEVPYQEIYDQWIMAESTVLEEANVSDFPDWEGPEIYELDGIEISVSKKGNEISKQSVKLAVASLIKTNDLNSDIVDYIAIFEGYIYIKSKNEKQIKSGYYKIAATTALAMRPDGTTSSRTGKYVLELIKENAHYTQAQKSIMQKTSNLKEGSSSSLVMLKGKIDEEFELHNYPYVTSEYKNKAFSIAKEKIKQELNLFPTMMGGDFAYKNITKLQLMDINDIIQDTVESITLDMGKKKTPQKRYTKGRGGFAGTAKKTSPGKL